VLVDTHCHLDFNSFDLDRQEVIHRARETGVGRILNPGIDLHSSQEAIRLSEHYPEVYSAVGVHPNEALTWDESSLRDLRRLAEKSKVVAIGEIGLDYYRDRAPKDLQKQVFLEQLALAGELNLPVIVHNRQANEDILSILKDWIVQLKVSGSLLAGRPGVLHSFSGDVGFAALAIQSNFFLGFTGTVTFNNALELQEVVQAIPADRILIETDAPFLTPHPNRGKRNEPANVYWVAKKIAGLRMIGEDDLINQTASNAARLFCW